MLPPKLGELEATVDKWAYLGNCHEYTFATELGSIFVVSPEVERVWRPGDSVSLRLAGHGLSVVAA